MTVVPFLIFRLILGALCPATFFAPRVASVLIALWGVNGLFLLKEKELLRTFRPFSFGYLTLLLSWAGLSITWSIIPYVSFFLLIRLCLLVGSLHIILQTLDVFTATQKENCLRSLAYGWGIGISLLSIEIFGGSPWQQFVGKESQALTFAPFVFTLCISTWAVVPYLCRDTMLRKHWVIVFLINLFLFYLMLKVDCDAAPLAFLLGWFTVGCFYLFPHFTRAVLILKSILAIILIPFFVNVLVNQSFIDKFAEKIGQYSYVHRLYILQSTSEKIRQHWLLGYGLDSSRVVGGEEKVWSFVAPDGLQRFIHSKEIPLHPHNAPMQWWLELGGIGALIISMLYFSFLKGIRYERTLQQASKVGFYVSTQVIGWTSLGTWQGWWLAMLILVGTLIMSKETNESCKGE